MDCLGFNSACRWRKVNHASGKTPSNNSFNRSANSIAFIRQLEWLFRCVRARLIRAFGGSVESTEP